MTQARPVVFLHIGASKTGTTFLQSLMTTNKERLAAAGYLFPGETWVRQVRAVQDVLGRIRNDPKLKAAAAGAWDSTVQEMLAHRGVASVLSMEFLSFADEHSAARVARSLEDADVHVILTVRDATVSIPAQWPTDVHNGSWVSWPEFMQGVRRAADVRLRWTRKLPVGAPALRSFLRAQDIRYMLDTWGRQVPAQRLHVVTVPPTGSEPMLLWERFARVLGVDPAVCPEPASRKNESLGYASTELLRRVNRDLGRLRRTDYNPTVKQHLALEVLSRRARKEPRARIDQDTYDFALGWNRRTRNAIEKSGARVVGSLDDLPTTSSPDRLAAAKEPQPAPTEEELLAAARAAVDGMQRLVVRRRRRLRVRGLETEVAAPGPPIAAGPDRWATEPDPVAAAARDVAELCRTAIDLRHRLEGS